MGIDARLKWVGGKSFPACELLRDVLIPLSREGLKTAGVDSPEADKYMGVIEERLSRERTGARWCQASLAEMKGQGMREEMLTALTAGMLSRQKTGLPVHEWTLASIEESGDWKPNFLRVEQYMTTDLFTVNENEVIDLVASVMDWQQVRHVAVEDAHHNLVGIVSHRTLLRFMAGLMSSGRSEPVPVSEVMARDPITVSPETRTLEAIELMRGHRVSCLPVVRDGKLVGMVSERDFMSVARGLLEQKLRE